MKNATPMPRSAAVAQGISEAAAVDEMTAYFRTEAFGLWAIPYTARKVVEALDTPRYSPRDPILALWNRGAYVGQVPACGYPANFRVVTTDASTQAYLRDQGWPQPSAAGIVVTFPRCAGVEVTTKNADGATTSTTKYFGQATAGSAIVTGSVQDLTPFARVWVTDGYAACGPTQLRGVCG